MLLTISVVVVVATVGAVIIYSSIRRRGAWGINVKEVCCPRCGKEMPAVRKPSSLKQTMFGGWSCQHCGCEMDKWGHAVFRQGCCCKCGYDLTANVSGICPECGTEITPP